jgi:hypothetical protein
VVGPPEVVRRTGTIATVESGRGIGTDVVGPVVQPDPVIVGPVVGGSG